MHIAKNICVFWFVYLVHCLYHVIPLTSQNALDKYILAKIVTWNNVENSTIIISRLNGTGMEPVEANTTIPKMRVKRQSSGGKYTDAAKMPQVKVLRLILQMIRNSWADVYVGGAHPFHHEVPKPIVQLYKQKVLEFFFPDVGSEQTRR